MPKQRSSVIPIRLSAPVSKADELVADFAYTLWLSSAFRGALPEEAFFTAVQLMEGKSLSGPRLMPKHMQNHHPVIEIKSLSGGGSK